MNRNIRIGIFSTIATLIIVGFSFYVNDKPYWYKKCNAVPIYVDDATGLRRKSPVKTLGLEIGYIQSVTLDGEKVLISVCVTGPVKLRPDTKAYIRTLGFLGDRFLELKPVDKISDPETQSNRSQIENMPLHLDAVKLKSSSNRKDSSILKIQYKKKQNSSKLWQQFLIHSYNWLIPSAQAQVRQGKSKTLTAERESELQETMKKVGKLVDRLTLLVGDVRSVTNQKEFKDIIKNLNRAISNMAKLMEPDGELSQNLIKSMTSLNNIMKKVETGEGSIGKLINDPDLYDEAKAALRSINLILGKAGILKTFVDMSAERINAFGGVRAIFDVRIEPNPTRYYLLGVANDPIGTEERIKTETINAAGESTFEEKVTTEYSGIKFTAMFGKYLGPLDLRVGLRFNQGALGAGYWFDNNRRFGVYLEGYAPGNDESPRARFIARGQFFSIVYAKAGVESFDKLRGHYPHFFGMGITFDDDDLKLLLAFR